jgi:N-acetylmuramoyl-L-alanine amidase
MIIVVRKSNIILIGLIFLLLISIYSINLGADQAATVSGGKNGDRTIIVDAGHGGEDPGKVGNVIGLKEKEISLKIAFKVKEQLEKDNYKVIMTRQEDILEYLPDTTNITQKRKEDLLRRKKVMDEAGADIVVSVHLNSFTETKYYGAQTFYPPGSPNSQKLAMSLQKALREQVDPSNKREPQLKKEPIIILKDLKTTTTIVECGFLSNPDEEKKLGTDEHQNKLAEAIKAGIDNYFK